MTINRTFKSIQIDNELTKLGINSNDDIVRIDKATNVATIITWQKANAILEAQMEDNREAKHWDNLATHNERFTDY